MRKPLAIAVLTLLGSTAFAAGEIYRWKDANGIWNYSDQHHPGAELVRGSRAPSTTPQTATTASPAPASPASAPLPATKEVTDQVRQDTANAKAEQCKKLTADYDKYVQARRIYKTDSEGKQVFMTEAEMEAARVSTRTARDLACAP